jgi:tripartite ATP-independent transporter DctM subunit
VPGLLMGASIAVAWWWVAKRENIEQPPAASWAERIKALREATWALVLPVIVIVGLKFGVFTPTEAAVVAVVYALLIGHFVYGELKPRELPELMLVAAKTSATIMFLVACALVSAWLITIADIPAQATALLEPFMGSKIALMFVMMVLVIVVGTALDLMPTVLILTPILMPVVKQAGIDPIYFGVMFIMNNAIGLLTPPVGTVLNVVAGVAKTGLDSVIKGVWPFLAAQTALLFLFVLFPQLVTVPASWFR